MLYRRLGTTDIDVSVICLGTMTWGVQNSEAEAHAQLDRAFDTHAANFGPLRNLHCPKLDSGLSALLEDLDQRGLLKGTLVVAIGEFGRSPRLGVSTSGKGNAPDGRDHWPYCYTALAAGAGVARGALYGKSDATGPWQQSRSL